MYRASQKVRLIYIAYISCYICHTTIYLASHESLTKDILLQWIFSTQGVTSLGRAGDMINMTTVSLKTMQRGLCRTAAHERRQAHTAHFTIILEAFKASWPTSGTGVAPQENVWWGQVRGAGRPLDTPRTWTSRAVRSAPAANFVYFFFSSVSWSTVLLEPLAVEQQGGMVGMQELFA